MAQNTYTKGKGVIIKVKSDDGTLQPILGQTGGSISQSLETIEVMTKDDATAQVYGTTHSWEVSLDALYVLNDAGFQMAYDAYQAAEHITVEIALEDATLSGEGLITSIDTELGMDDMVSISMSITGSGDLTRTEK